MTPCEGKHDFKSMYMVDYVPKKYTTTRAPPPRQDNCLIIGLGRNALKTSELPEKHYDVLCPIEREFYPGALKRVEDKYPRVKKIHFGDDEIDTTPIDEFTKDQLKTEYIVEYCDRDQPYVFADSSKRARRSQTIRLADDIKIPETTYGYFHRPMPAEKIVPPSVYTIRPRTDKAIVDELRRITRAKTGNSVYQVEISQLGGIILDTNPYGPCKESP